MPDRPIDDFRHITPERQRIRVFPVVEEDDTAMLGFRGDLDDDDMASPRRQQDVLEDVCTHYGTDALVDLPGGAVLGYAHPELGGDDATGIDMVYLRDLAEIREQPRVFYRPERG